MMQCWATALVGLCRKQVTDTSRSFFFVLVLGFLNPSSNLVSFVGILPAQIIIIFSDPASLFQFSSISSLIFPPSLVYCSISSSQ